MYSLSTFLRKSAFLCIGLLILSSNAFAHTALNQPKMYFLAEEQSFLEQIYLSQYILKTGSWKMQDKTHWILDVPEFAYVGKKEPVRFVMTQATSYPDQWLLYVLEQINGQWIGRYGSVPVALFKKNQTGKWDNTLIPNLTATNLVATLKSKNLTYYDDREQKIKQIGEMCASKIDNNVNHRRLVEDIFNVEKPSRSFTEAEYKLYLGNPFYTSSLVQLNQRAAANNVFGGIYGDMSFQEAFTGSSSKEHWDKHFSTPTEDGLTSETITNPVFKKARTEMVDAFIKNQTYTRIDIMKAIPEFNHHVYEINKICKELKPKYAEAENMPVYFTDKEDSYAVKKEAWEMQRKKNAAKNYLQSLADLGAKTHLDFLSHESKLAALWQSKDFESQVGHFDAKDCSKGGSELGFISTDTVDAAIKDINQQNLAALNKNTKISTQKLSSPEVLKTYILSSPYSVQSALQQSKSIGDAALTCRMIREVYDDDQFDLYLDRGLMVAGLAAGFTVGALTGADLLAPAIAPYVMAGTDAVFLMRGSYQWYDGYYLDKNVRYAMGAKQIGQQQALNTLSEAQQKQTAGKTTIGMTLGGNVVGYGIGKGVQAYKNSSALKTVTQQETANAFKETNGLSTYKFTQPTNDLPTSEFRSNYLQRKLNPGDEIQIGDQSVTVVSQTKDQLTVQGTNGQQVLSGTQLENAKFAKKPVTKTLPVNNRTETTTTKSSIAAGGIKDFTIENLASGVTKSGERVEAFYHTAANINGKNQRYITIDIFGGESGILKERARVITSIGQFPMEANNVRSLIFKSKNKFYMAKFEEGSAEIIQLGQYSKPYEFEIIPGEYGPGQLVLRNNELIKYTTFGKRDLGLVVRSDGTIDGIYEVAKDGSFIPENIHLKQFVKDNPENKLLGQQIFESDNVDVSSLDDGYLVLYPNSAPVFIDKYGRIAEGTLNKNTGQAVFKMPEGTTSNPVYISEHKTNILPVETRKFSTETLGEYRAMHFGETPVIGQWHTGPKENLHNISLIDGFELPTAANGPLCGTGSLNCTGHAMAMDSFLNKGPAMGVMRDPTYLPDFIDHNLFSNEGKLLHPTIPYHVEHVSTYMNAAEAAAYYASKVETFETLPSWIERLNKLPEGGTAVIFEQAPPIPVVTETHITYPESSYTHVFNVKKIDGEIIFFDSQQGLVTQYSQTILANPKSFQEVDMIETTQFHQNSLTPSPLAPIEPTAPRQPQTSPVLNPVKTESPTTPNTPVNKTENSPPESSIKTSTALVPYIAPDNGAKLEHISEILALKPEKKNNWTQVTISYENKTYPSLELKATVIEYDLKNKRLLLSGERNYQDFFWIDAKDIAVKNLIVHIEKIPSNFFNTTATSEFKSFRERFTNQDLQKGDLINIGKEKPLIVESQRGIVVVVREKEDVVRRMTKTELEKARLQGHVDQIDEELNQILVSAKQEELQVTKSFNVEKADVLENQIMTEQGDLMEELAFMPNGRTTGNRSLIPQDVRKRLANFSATKDDFDNAWLHDYNADKIELIYADIQKLNEQAIAYVEPIFKDRGFTTQRIIEANQFSVLKITPPENLIKNGSFHKTRKYYFDPLQQPRGRPDNPKYFYYDLTTVRDIFENILPF